MRNLLQTSVAISCVIVSDVQVALITDYTLNESTSIVTDTRNNLEWLRWDVTDGLSINEALSIHQGDGWEFAFNAQMAKPL